MYSMDTFFGQAQAPSDDKRWKIVESTARRHGKESHALIETLHTVQECFGYLDESALRYVAAVLRVPLSRVYGAATFYHFFTLKPKGKHTCVVCTGTACYIKGAQALLGAIEKRFGYDLSRTTTSIREVYSFNESCQGTVTEAITAFLESEEYEDAVRLAISLGGDADTLACITGDIAGAFYGAFPRVLGNQP